MSRSLNNIITALPVDEQEAVETRYQKLQPSVSKIEKQRIGQRAVLSCRSNPDGISIINSISRNPLEISLTPAVGEGYKQCLHSIKRA